MGLPLTNRPEPTEAELLRAAEAAVGDIEWIDGSWREGEVPGVPHQRIVVRLLTALLPLFDAVGRGETLPDTFVRWGMDWLRPDLAVYPVGELRGSGGIRDVAPLLVCEIVSRDRRHDLETKASLYRMLPYLIIDPDERDGWWARVRHRGEVTDVPAPEPVRFTVAGVSVELDYTEVIPAEA